MKPSRLSMLFALVKRFTNETTRDSLSPVELASLEVFLRMLGETGMADSVVAYFIANRDRLARVEATASRAKAMLN